MAVTSAPKEVIQLVERLERERNGSADWAATGGGRFAIAATIAAAIVSLGTIALFSNCQPNAAPFILPVVGDSILHAGREYAFSVRCADVERDSVAVRLSWGDGDTSDWSHFAESGDTILLSHTWSQTGYLVVEAQSMDRHGAAAGWLTRRKVRVLDTTVVKWIVPIGRFNWFSSVCPAVAVDGTIYVGSCDGLHALGPDGNQTWFRSMPYVTSPVVGADGTIYVCDGSNYYWRTLSALTSHGSVRWDCDHVGLEYAPALDTDGTIYAAALDSLFAFRPSGVVKWIAQLPGWAATSPVIAADGTIYVGSRMDARDTCAIYAFGPDGTPKWHLAVHAQDCNGLSLGLAVALDGTIRYSCYDEIGCINSDGSVQWTSALHGLHVGQPAVDPSGVAYPVCWFGSGACAINSDGTVRWRVETRGASTTPVIGMDGRLWTTGDVSTGNLDSIYRVNADGSVGWGMAVRSGNVTPPTVGPDSTVYIGMGDSCLYALRGSSLLAASGWPKSQHDVRNTGCASTPNCGYGSERQISARHDDKEKP